MRIPRFRIRTLMITVAAVALLLWGGIGARKMYRLSRYYRAKAAEMRAAEITSSKYHSQMKRRLASIESQRNAVYKFHGVANTETWRLDIIDSSIAKRPRALRVPAPEYFARLKGLYEYAALHPWERVSLDSPPPD